jgi:hypothetical protein
MALGSRLVEYGRNAALLLVFALQASAFSTFQYNICNGLSNQLLIHASAIANAIQQKSTVVQVPDYFIVNGEQTSNDPVLPLPENSLPLDAAFDVLVLRQRVQELGIQMELVRWDSSKGSGDNTSQNASYTSLSKGQQPPDCPGLTWLSGADPHLVLQILKAFQPSSSLRKIIDMVRMHLEQQHQGGLNQGICFHHRDGADWHDHCQRWSALTELDGIYRGNCKAVASPVRRTKSNATASTSLLEVLQHRALTSTDRWIYYCGDHSVPEELQSQDQYTVVTKDQFISDQDKQTVQALKPGTPVRDLWALIDFYICGSLHYLVGNSVSTFSALQVALREQEGSYWYNSQSIPLGDVWNIYQIPIVYTYTELSDVKGKYMLQASIASVRQHMPRNKIYILYHGNEDTSFRLWLQRDQNVTLYQHEPTWKPAIEHMRLRGNALTSHLFLHRGNYFGTWQRIDIPKFIETEYCLLLDADTVILRPFTLRDFGLNLTYSLGMSAERHRHHVGSLLNAGVTLMNIPYMRATYDDFVQFVLDHVDGHAFNHPAPSDQGAYLDFYESTVQQISNFWNWKAYWGVKQKQDMFQQIKILHFHGIKPHDYVKKILGESCDKAIDDLCQRFRQPIFRFTVQQFLLAAASIPNFHQNYCESSFDLKKRRGCISILDGLKDRGYYSPSPGEMLQPDQSNPRHLTVQKDGYWDGDQSGLNANVVTVSRPIAALAAKEEGYKPSTKKLHELSYEYLNFSNEIELQRSLSYGDQVLPVLWLQFRMLLLTGVFLTFLLYAHFRTTRRLLFVLVCASVTMRHMLAFRAMEHHPTTL